MARVNPDEIDLTPPRGDLLLYAGGTDELVLYRRDPDTLVTESLAGWTSAAAYWVAEKGDTTQVAWTANIVSDQVVVQITEAMKAQMGSTGFWKCEAVDDSGNPIVLGEGECTLEGDT